ncbi:MAG: hypothetical protein AAF206_10580 [Bacteroidota bacterium]
MKHLIFLFFLGCLHLSYSQSFPELEKALAKRFPESATEDRRWVFFADRAEIEKIEKPYLLTYFPKGECYTVKLTNYLGYHINEDACVILFDRSTAKIVLVKPLWHGGVSSELIRLFINQGFESQEELQRCLNKIHELMTINSGFRFVQTAFTDKLITYDLVHIEEDTYTTTGNGISSTIRYQADEVWRQIEVEIKDLKLKTYTSINPSLKDSKEFQDSYRRKIK